MSRVGQRQENGALHSSMLPSDRRSIPYSSLLTSHIFKGGYVVHLLTAAIDPGLPVVTVNEAQDSKNPRTFRLVRKRLVPHPVYQSPSVDSKGLCMEHRPLCVTFHQQFQASRGLSWASQEY